MRAAPMSASQRVMVLYGDNLTRKPSLLPRFAGSTPLSSLLRFAPYVTPYPGLVARTVAAARGATGAPPASTSPGVDGR